MRKAAGRRSRAPHAGVRRMTPRPMRLPADLPLVHRRSAASGTHARILAVVARIPPGRVATYGGVAARAGLGGQARLVGYALHALPEGSPLPWHRVLGAAGRLSLMRLDPDAGLRQRLRLEREGVRFDGRGRVDLARYGWPRAPRAKRAQAD